MQIQSMKQSTQSWCSGTTQGNGVRREMGEGFRMVGHMYTTAYSCWCITKPPQYCKVISLQLNKFFKNFNLKKSKGTNLDCCMLSNLSSIQLFATLCTIANQAPLSMGFSRQEYCSGLPCPSPRDLPNPGNKPTSLTSPALTDGSLPQVPPGKSPFKRLHQWKNEKVKNKTLQNNTF